MNDVDDTVYVGSTVVGLSDRKSKHRWEAKRNSKYKVHDHMRNVGVEHFYIELIENYPCNNIEELTAKEGEWIRAIGTLNQVVAGRTDKQYYDEHRERIKKNNNTDSITYWKPERKKNNIEIIVWRDQENMRGTVTKDTQREHIANN